MGPGAYWVTSHRLACCRGAGISGLSLAWRNGEPTASFSEEVTTMLKSRLAYARRQANVNAKAGVCYCTGRP